MTEPHICPLCKDPYYGSADCCEDCRDVPELEDLEEGLFDDLESHINGLFGGLK